MAGVVEGVQHPPVERRVVLPLGEPGVRGRSRAPVPGWGMARSTGIDAMITRRGTGPPPSALVAACHPLERPLYPLVKLFQLSPAGANTRSGSASMSNDP